MKLAFILVYTILLSACGDPRRMAELDEYYSAERILARDSAEKVQRMSDPKWTRLYEIDTSCERWSELREGAKVGRKVFFPRLRVFSVFEDEIILLSCGLVQFDREIVLSGRSYTYEFERMQQIEKWPELHEKDHIRLNGVFTGVDKDGRVNISARSVENLGYVSEP